MDSLDRPFPANLALSSEKFVHFLTAKMIIISVAPVLRLCSDRFLSFWYVSEETIAIYGLEKSQRVQRIVSFNIHRNKS